MSNFYIHPDKGLTARNEEAEKVLESPRFDNAYHKMSQLFEEVMESPYSVPLMWNSPEVKEVRKDLSSMEEEALKLVCLL